MLEQQFIQFTAAIQGAHNIAVPISDDGLEFFMNGAVKAVGIVNTNGDIISDEYQGVTSTEQTINNTKYSHYKIPSAKSYVAQMETFRLRILKQRTAIWSFTPQEGENYTQYTALDADFEAGSYNLQISEFVIGEYIDSISHYRTMYTLMALTDDSVIYTSGRTKITDGVNAYFTLKEATHVIVGIVADKQKSEDNTIKATGSITINKDDYLYSNVLRYVPNEDGYLSSLQYYCNDPEFGFPFFKSGNVKYSEKISLPILLHAAQYTQTDKIYETRNGEQIVLYATINKEYEGETDYIPEAWHEKIVTALSCDEVYINGERVTKSDSYEIDHDNYTLSDCGVRLMRATFKCKTNITSRNSNY